MTANGWLQIVVVPRRRAAPDEAARPVPGACVRSPAHVARPARAPGRTSALPPDPRRRDARDALDRVRRRDAALQPGVVRRPLRDPAAPGLAAVGQPAGAGCGPAVPGVQHGGVVHDEHQLAGLRRREHGELPHADGRPRVPQLHVGRRRHRPCRRVRQGHRPPGERHAGQLLGRSHARVAVGAAAALPGRFARAGVAGRRAEPQAVRSGRARRSADRDDDGCDGPGDDDGGDRTGDRAGPGGVAGDHQGARHQRRRVLQREQRAPVREPDAADQLPRDDRHLRDPRRPGLHARRDDRVAKARLGGVGGHGVPVPGRRDDGLLGGGARQSRCSRPTSRPPRSRPAATWKAKRSASGSPPRRSSPP